MRKAVVVLAVAVLVTGVAGAASVPVETRAAALLELQAAIEDEQRALELMRKDPPRREAAANRLASARDRLAGVRDFLSTAPGAGAAEARVGEAWQTDVEARDAVWRREDESAVALIRQALETKRAALPLVRAAQPPRTAAECSDGKDNDGDGITDWQLEPGCTSARDARESTKPACAVESRLAAGRLVLSGSCSGAFSELDVTLLDGVQLNGRFDIAHAPSCSPPTLTRIRCKTKDGAQNPQHLIDVRMTTTRPAATRPSVVAPTRARVVRGSRVELRVRFPYRSR
jgi:hypothetical protein